MDTLFYDNDEFISELPPLSVESDLTDQFDLDFILSNYDSASPMSMETNFSKTSSPSVTASDSPTDFNPDDFLSDFSDRIHSPHSQPHTQSQAQHLLPIHAPVLIQPQIIPINGMLPITFAVAPQKMQQISAISDNNLVSSSSSVRSVVRPKMPANTNATLEALNQLNGIVDEKTLKKQKRMIKNRQSASLSRKKNQEYVVSLQCKIGHLEKENTQLKKENSSLRSQLTDFSQRCQCSHNKITKFVSDKLGHRLSSKTKINSVVLLAMVLTISLNIGVLKNLVRSDLDAMALSESQPEFHVGRRGLLWYEKDENSTDEAVQAGPANLHEFGKVANSSSRSAVVSSSHAENMRLASDLQKLIGVNTYLKNVTAPVVVEPLPYVPRMANFRNLLKPEGKSMQIFEPQLQEEYKDFFNKINQQDDIFYVVSFNFDHLLRPASAYNKSSRPKMALMLPAGDGSARDMFSLMQIDCEVTKTKLVNFTKNAIPRPMRKLKKPASSPSPAEFNARNISSMHKRPTLLGDDHFYRPLFFKQGPIDAAAAANKRKPFKNSSQPQPNIANIQPTVKFLRMP